AEHREGHVVDRDAAAGGAAQDAAMGVAVNRELGPKLVERAGEAGGAEKGEDLQRLALQRLPAGRVVEQGDAVPGAQLEERLFQLELLLDAGVDEALDRLFAELLEL